MKLDHALLSHIGQRDNNEDACCALPDLGLYAVADGMGGYDGGEVASRLTIESVARFVRYSASDDDITWPYPADRNLSAGENELAIATRLANEEIARHRSGRLEHMGSTVALLRLRDRRAIIGHVGDSRVYRLRGGRLELLTRDHSLYEALAEAGSELPPRDRFPHAHVVTRALGTATASPDLRVEPAEPGDVYLLCTDGLVDSVPDERLAALVGAADLAAACHQLVAEALRRGARDNITVVLVRVDGEEA